MSNHRSKYYLINLYRQNKWLCFIVILISLLHLNANFFFGGQQSPFFRWDLYARPVRSQDTFSFYEVRYNDNRSIKFKHTWTQPQELFLTNTLMNYAYMLKHDGKTALNDYIDNWSHSHPITKAVFPGLKLYPDTAEMHLYPDWYIKKIEQFTGDKVNKAVLYQVKIALNEQNKAEFISEQELKRFK